MCKLRIKSRGLFFLWAQVEKKQPSQGRWCALACVGQNEDTAMRAADRSFGMDVDGSLTANFPESTITVGGGEFNVNDYPGSGQTGQIL